MMSWFIIELTFKKVLAKTLQIGAISNSEKTQSRFVPRPGASEVF
jgi:hypothetical protein